MQLLADTVPAVAGCERATVYLWESDTGQLVPRARSSGRQPADAYLGPIVPLAEPEPGVSGTEPAAAGRSRIGAGPGPTGTGRARMGPNRSAAEEAPGAPPGVRIGLPVVDHLINRREVVVIDASSEDQVLRDLLARSGTAASVVTSLFAAGEFLGLIAANFGPEEPTDTVHDPDLHERLTGLADQAATALQNLGLLEKVSHMAWHDSLTGLPNRRLFEDRVEQELVRSRRVGEPVCMFFVDLDYFKGVNDTLGHAAGDDLVRQVSRRLVATVRRQDTVARVGGDEFAILLPGLSEQADIDELAERTLEAMGTPFAVFGEEVETSASIGIAVAPEHGDTYDDLLNRADRGHVPGQGPRAQLLRDVLRPRDGPGGTPAGRGRRRRSRPTWSARSSGMSSSCSTSPTSTCVRPRWSGSRRWSAGTTRGSACSSRPPSSRWPSAAG